MVTCASSSLFYRTDCECTLYSIPLELYSYILSQSEDVPGYLIPPAATLFAKELPWREDISALEDRLLLLMQEGAATMAVPAGVMSSNDSGTSQESEMNVLHAEGRQLLQLSVLSWAVSPTQSLRSLVVNATAHDLLKSFVEGSTELQAALQPLSLVAEALNGTRDATELLVQLGAEVDESASEQQIVEWLELRVSAAVEELSRSILVPFLWSTECNSLQETVCKTPSKGVGLALLFRSGTWLEMFRSATEKLASAVSVVDVQVAGLPLVFVNSAWEQLTGYDRADALGCNCRMLQGPATEPSAVAQLVAGIRSKRSCTVRLTNYTKEGSAFVNELSLHPVCDARGVYRYVVGLSSDASSDISTRAMLAAVRQLVPHEFPAALVEKVECVVIDKAAQEQQYLHSMLPAVTQQLLSEGEYGEGTAHRGQ